MGDPIFDAYYASTIQAEADPARQQRTMRAAGAALLDRIGKPSILISHSQGVLAAWVIADVRPTLTKAIVAMEPTGPPFQNKVFSNASARPWGLTDIPITYSPPVRDPEVDLVKECLPPTSTNFVPCIIQANEPPPRKLQNLAEVKVLLVTAEASYHAMYDHGVVAFLRQAGVRTEHADLAARGIKGNGHLLFMEKNSDEIAALVEEWITKV
jgi:pimeloyl-ACP methyl ester carboxylesterase